MTLSATNYLSPAKHVISYITLIFILTCNTVSTIAPHVVGTFRNSLLMADSKAFRDISGPSIKGSSSMLWVKSVALLLWTQHRKLCIQITGSIRNQILNCAVKCLFEVANKCVLVHHHNSDSCCHVEHLSVQKRP